MSLYIRRISTSYWYGLSTEKRWAQQETVWLGVKNCIVEEKKTVGTPKVGNSKIIWLSATLTIPSNYEYDIHIWVEEPPP